ncbi:YHYH domain-containing protein [Limisphaera sp. VF-2]|jgi:hypothetical protein|uniref:YHYH domain-containing protein n=1 Tax=Limisphaera sp. VF-2 TaxID=3400418 RepID=UPI00176D9FF4
MRTILQVLVCVSVQLPALGHPGATDSRGGHYNHFTGEYHFHHGMTAHYHPGGLCPYGWRNPASGIANNSQRLTDVSTSAIALPRAGAQTPVSGTTRAATRADYTVPPNTISPRLLSPSRALSPVRPFVAENGSYYGQRNAYGVPKTVYVKGYFRRDGTYVRGHYRSARRR